MALTRLGYIAVKRETAAGTAVKPTNFLRFKDGDIMRKQEIIANNPIQNNRWNALNAVKNKITTDGSYNVDLDANECVHFIGAAMGTISTADIGSTTGQVFRHTINVANSLYTLSLEQLKGDGTDTTNNRQNYQVDRAFGVYVGSFKLSGKDGIINMEVGMKALGVLQKSALITNAASAATSLSLDGIEGFAAADSVTIYDRTPQSQTLTISAISAINRTLTVNALSTAYTVANFAKVELQPQTPSYAIPAKVMSFINARFQTGSDLTTAAAAPFFNVEDWELMFDNGIEERYGSLRASPSVIAAKGAMATLKFTRYFDTVLDRDLYIDQNKQAIILNISNDEIVSSTDTNAAKYTIRLEMSDVRYTSQEMPTGTDELFASTVEASLYYDATDGRALRALVTNSRPAATFS